MEMKTKDVCDNSATIFPPIAKMERKVTEMKYFAMSLLTVMGVNFAFPTVRFLAYRWVQNRK